MVRLFLDYLYCLYCSIQLHVFMSIFMSILTVLISEALHKVLKSDYKNHSIIFYFKLH